MVALKFDLKFLQFKNDFFKIGVKKMSFFKLKNSTLKSILRPAKITGSAVSE